MGVIILMGVTIVTPDKYVVGVRSSRAILDNNATDIYALVQIRSPANGFVHLALSLVSILQLGAVGG